MNASAMLAEPRGYHEWRGFVRRFTEVDLRRMMEYATGFRRARRKGRWIIETKHQDRKWEIVVEPNADTEFQRVITAYEVKRKRK